MQYKPVNSHLSSQNCPTLLIYVLWKVSGMNVYGMHPKHPEMFRVRKLGLEHFQMFQVCCTLVAMCFRPHKALFRSSESHKALKNEINPIFNDKQTLICWKKPDLDLSLVAPNILENISCIPLSIVEHEALFYFSWCRWWWVWWTWASCVAHFFSSRYSLRLIWNFHMVIIYGN